MPTASSDRSARRARESALVSPVPARRMFQMSVLVVVPTYNERVNLPLLVSAVLAREDYRLLVADDGSPDGTGAVADDLAARWNGRVQVLHRTGPRGLGRSYVEAFQLAVEQPVDVVCQMDADLSHDPAHLPALVEAAGQHDLVVGSRYLNGISVVNWPLRRIVLSTTANAYIRAVTGLGVRDCTSGFRCWRREALARLPLRQIVSEGYSFQVETLWEAARLGFRTVEVPIVFVERREGQSKLNRSVLVEALWMPWRLRFGGHRR
jgi:dolichol-phosphate mannosyltransferase